MLQKTHFKYSDIGRLKIKEWKWYTLQILIKIKQECYINQKSRLQRKSSDIERDVEGLMTNGPYHQEDRAILSMYVLITHL